MSLFNNENKIANRQFREQMIVQKDANDTSLTQQMIEQGNVAYDPQVSAMILESNRRFLNWEYDFKNGVRNLSKEDEGFIEPFGDEPLSFLDAKSGDIQLLNDFDACLVALYGYGEKYGKDDNVRRSFNNIARVRISMLNASRTTGKPAKLAKSQYVESSSRVSRLEDKGGGNQKFLGLF